jgi:molybdate transport system permease protein
MIDARTLELLAFTMGTALLATLLVLPFGVALGWLLARSSGFTRRVLETVCLLPLVLPPTAVGLVLLTALSADRPLGRLLHRYGVDLLFTWRAVVLAGAVMGAPLLIWATRRAFEEVDDRLLQLARTLGDSRWAAFRRVALPLGARGIVGGALLTFTRALGEFGATVLVAGNIPGRTQTLSLAIFEHAQTGDEHQALGLLAVSVALAFVAVALTGSLVPRKARA